MHIYNKKHVIIIAFYSYMFRRLLCHLQGEMLCTLTAIVTVRDLIVMQTQNETTVLR